MREHFSVVPKWNHGKKPPPSPNSGITKKTSVRAQKLCAILLVVPKQNRQNTTRQASRPCRVTNPIGAKCMRRRWMRRMRRTKRF